MGQRIPKTVLKKHLHRAGSPFEQDQPGVEPPESSPIPPKKKRTASKKKAVSGSVHTDPVNGFEVIEKWLATKEQTAFPFQEETWHAYGAGQSGLVNAPTGFGKTFAVFLGVLIDYMNRTPDYQTRTDAGLQLLWISPLRALGTDLARAMQTALDELQIPWTVAVRNGDTSTAERTRQKKQIPEVLVITPESLHLLMAQKGHQELFRNVQCVCVDEWHELLSTKRGVQVELALAHLAGIASDLRIWGLSATIGNLEEALAVLTASRSADTTLIRSNLHKQIDIQTILPDTVETLPWAGHLGIRMLDKVIPVIRESRSTLLFTNTRAHSERWYQALLDAAPDLAGEVALHHSAIDPQLRNWVEAQLHQGTLKCVVCTASLDLGVDFRPVDTIIQVGSPKGIARFLQRAGRSGHQPGEVSRVFFVPTHSLELTEVLALQRAYREGVVERRPPLQLCYDVLVQYAVTLAVGDGFFPEALFKEVTQSACFRELTVDEFDWVLRFITVGGDSLDGYDEYHRVVIDEDGCYRVPNRRTALRHRMHIGTIVSNASVKVRFVGGGYIGHAEESFIGRLKPGTVFVLGGKKLELVHVRDMEAVVRKSKAKNALVPSWSGGRLSLSNDLGQLLRGVLEDAASPQPKDELLQFLQPLFQLQRQRSVIPEQGELLVEKIHTRDGYHLFIYPFEGRQVHTAMAGLLAWRIAQTVPITFSIAANDYGFELLSDAAIPVSGKILRELLSVVNLDEELRHSVNEKELARRKFRDIAVIAGLVFPGTPGAQKKARHLQSSASLVYDVLAEAEPQNLLFQQATIEAVSQELEFERLYEALKRIESCRLRLETPDRFTPFSFPIKVDSLREELSTEKLEDRIRKMQAAATRWE
ncbi:MAG: ligase-associated DNA damage response DEXH box helicase [Sphingobacteriales bacterium]|nr:MAG: ligase-associated DNA damage response DEXH box helicase [Sphingobacteriales bacterium]